MKVINFMNPNVKMMNESNLDKFVAGAELLAKQVPNIENELTITEWDFDLNERTAIETSGQAQNDNVVAACHAITLAAAATIDGDITLQEYVQISMDVYSMLFLAPDRIKEYLEVINFYDIEEQEKYKKITLDEYRKMKYRKTIGLTYGIKLSISMAR